MAIVDTSFLVALHFEGDKFHRAALEANTAGERLLVPAEIWAEYADVVMRLARPEQVSELLKSTLSGPFYVEAVFSPETYAELAERGAKARPTIARTGLKALSLFDVIVCAAAERYRESILTFDEGIVAAVRAKLFPGARIA